MTDTAIADASAPRDLAWPGLSKNMLFFLLIVLILVLYCAPLIVIAKVYIDNIALGTALDEDRAVVAWFIKFAEGQEHTLSQVHKILIPLITFIAAASFATARASWRTLFLSVLILFFFFLAIGMQVAFEASLPSKVETVSPFFTRLEETLVTYLMLILGLQSAQASGEEVPETPAPAPEGGKAGGSEGDQRGQKKNERDLKPPKR
jgi:hypothetical protein